jgi:hypothetical protein
MSYLKTNLELRIRSKKKDSIGLRLFLEIFQLTIQ